MTKRDTDIDRWIPVEPGKVEPVKAWVCVERRNGELARRYLFATKSAATKSANELRAFYGIDARVIPVTITPEGE